MTQPPANPYPSQPGSGSPYGSHPQQPGSGSQYGSYPQQQQPGYGSYPQQQQPGYGSQYGSYPQQQQSGYGSQYGSQPQQQQPGYGPYAQQQQGSDSTYGSYPQQQSSGYPQQPDRSFGDPVPSFDPPEKKSKVGKVLLIVFSVMLVLCLGGGAAVYFLTKDTVDDVVEATTTRVAAPETLAGRPKINDPEMQSVVEDMLNEMKKEVPDATSTAGGFYGNPAKQDMIMIAAASGLVPDPKKQLANDGKDILAELKAAKLTPIQPGPLGGEAQCGDGKVDDIKVGVCHWADHGSVGMIVVYFKSAATLQKDFAAMRGEIEKRS